MNTENDDIEIEVDGDDDLEIIIEDDTPEVDRDKVRRAENAEPPGDDSDDDGDGLAGYSEGVKKRISKLRYQFHEERRAKEAAERLREEAIRFAEIQQKSADGLRKQLSAGQGAVVSQAKGRVESQLEAAKTKFKQAYEAGDSDALVEAQASLNSLQNEMHRLENYRPAQPANPAPSAAAPPVSSPQVRKPPQKALDWASRNAWFQKDDEMTGYAFGVHERLVKSGIDPEHESYYTQIDESMKKRFPEKFAEAPRARKASSVVASSSRTSATNPESVVITQSALKLIKRLNITPQQYAAQILKDRKDKDNG